MSPHNTSPAGTPAAVDRTPSHITSDTAEDQQTKINRAIIERDRDFRIHAETLGDVMLQMIEQLRLRNILRTLPPLSVEVLWLMLELLDMRQFDLENRMICEVSYGYLDDATREDDGKDQQGEPSKRSVGHFRRAITALINAGVLKCLVKGNGRINSKYEIFVPRTVGHLRAKKGQLSGRGTSSDTLNRAPVTPPTKPITRASDTLYSAPETPRGASGARFRVSLARDAQVFERDTLSCSAAAAAAALRGQQQSPEDCASGGSENRRQAIELLIDQGIPGFDAADILNDPKIRIAEDKLCDVIRRIAADRPGKKNNPGGWWRIALQKHQGYGDDPVIQTITAAKQRPREPEPDYFEAEGYQLVQAMSEDDLFESHAVLIGFYEKQGNAEALKMLNAIDDPRNDRSFWRAVGKNKQVLGVNQMRTNTGGQS